MPTQGSGSTAVAGINALFTLAGNVRGLCERFSAEWGFDQEENSVAGTPYPVVLTAGFHGKLTLEEVYSTDTPSLEAALLTLANGQVAAINMVWTGKDLTGTTRTYTFTGSVYPEKVYWDFTGPGKVARKVDCKLNALPVIT